MLRIWLDKVPDYSPSGMRYFLETDYSGEKGSKYSRWLMPTEALAVQGFPVHPKQLEVFRAAAPDLRLCSFHTAREGRKGRAVIQQAGNSMNACCIYACFLHSAACWVASAETNRTLQRCVPFCKRQPGFVLSSSSRVSESVEAASPDASLA